MPNKLKFKDLFKFRILKYCFLTVILYLLGDTLFAQISEINWSEINILYRFIFLSVSFEIISRFMISLSYERLLFFYRNPLSLKTCIGISWLSFGGKYLPGKIALVGSAIYLLKLKNISTATACVVPIAVNVVTIVVALFLSIPLLKFKCNLNLFLISYLIIPASSLIIFYFIDIKPITSLFSKMGLPAIYADRDIIPFVSLFMFVGLQCICAGISMWLLTKAFYPIDTQYIPKVIAISSFSGLMGLIAFFSPAGIGVRDGFYFIYLEVIIGSQSAALATCFLRVIQTLVDIACIGTGAILVGKTDK